MPEVSVCQRLPCARWCVVGVFVNGSGIRKSEGSVLLEEVSRRETETVVCTDVRKRTGIHHGFNLNQECSVQVCAEASTAECLAETTFHNSDQALVDTTHPRCVRRNKSPGDASVRHVRLRTGLFDGG